MESAHGIAEAMNTRRSYIGGVWIGIVEDTADPDRLGRVRVRIPQFHGSPQEIPTESLPWAMVEERGGGIYDAGSFTPMPVGAWVTVDFLQDHRSFPIVRGTIRGAPDNLLEALTTGGKLTPDSDVDATKQWVPPRGSETPKEAFTSDDRPTRQIWNKSVRGHSITVEDREEAEFLKITDRAGQVLEMSCASHPLTNAQNWEQRGDRDATQGTQLLHQALKDGHAHIRLMDLSGQEVILDATQGNEKILLRNRSKTSQSEQTIEMSAKRGAEFIAITDSRGSSLTFQANDPRPIVMRDFSGNEMAFNAESGQIEMTGSRDFSHSIARDLLQTVGSNIIQKVSGTKDVTIGGKKIETVVGDSVDNVLGGVSQIVAGTYQLMVGNSPTGGIPATTALELSTVLGGIRLAVNDLSGVGDILLETLNPASAIKLTNKLCLLKMSALGLEISVGPPGAQFVFQVDPAGAVASLSTGLASIKLTKLGVITINGGVIPCNNFLVCAFTGAPHGTSPKLLVP